jgi:hypothetical protein
VFKDGRDEQGLTGLVSELQIFNFTDIKPGDEEGHVSLHVFDTTPGDDW